MTKRLKHIGVIKFGIVLGAFYGLISLIMIPFFLLGIVISSIAPAQQSAMQQGFTTGLGLVFCILFPVIYAVMGCLSGMLAALIYNLVASWTGGIEFEVE
jgi:hypothetical protein